MHVCVCVCEFVYVCMSLCMHVCVYAYLMGCQLDILVDLAGIMN